MNYLSRGERRVNAVHRIALAVTAGIFLLMFSAGLAVIIHFERKYAGECNGASAEHRNP